MSAKLKSLQDLRDLIKAGKFNDRDHKRLFFEDINGKRVAITSDGALEAIEARIGALNVSES